MIEDPILRTIIFSIILGTAGIVLSDKFKIPGILFYFAMGIAAGPSFTGLLNPAMLGNGLTIMITVFVTIILFEGGLTLDINQIKSLKSVLLKEIILSVIIMTSVGFISAVYIIGLPWEISIIFAALIVVTGPTVIKPVIRHIDLSNRVKNFLNGEAVLIDAVGAILAIITLEFVLTSHEISLSIAGFAGSLLTGMITGTIFGFLIKYLITGTSIIPRSSYSFFIMGFVFLSYISSDAIVPESGLLTVVIVGIVLSTLSYREKKKIQSFKDQITRIVTSILFILLSANFNISYINQYLNEGLITVLIIILARFPVIFLSTMKEDFSAKEKIFMSWLGPRGIIALSVASIAAFKLKAMGIEKAETIEILIFMLISSTVLLQGLSAKWIAGKLNILEKGDRNIIILGVNNISLMIAAKWSDDRAGVLFVDSHRKNCQLAEQKGFTCLEGNALDPATYSSVELDDYTSALAASDNNEINIIFCRFLKESFGIQNVFTALNEKASDELSEIIKNDNIKAAFRTKNNGDSDFPGAGFLAKIKDLFSQKKQELRWLQIKNTDCIKHGPGDYPFPDDVTIFIVARNRIQKYIYHSAFELNAGDEIYVMASPDNLNRMENLLSAPV
jgi:NhaP-type Na+/H+ or K+/H+ antiporter/Trk K+ transport system NAD-binding subunit